MFEDFFNKYDNRFSEKGSYKYEFYEEWVNSDTSGSDRRFYGSEPTLQEIYNMLMDLFGGNKDLVEKIIKESGVLRKFGAKLHPDYKLSVNEYGSIFSRVKEKLGNTSSSINPDSTPYKSRFSSNFKNRGVSK